MYIPNTVGPLPLIRTNGAVILGMVYNFIPFMILQIHTSLAKMDKSLLEAANDLGATPVQAFLRVTLPLSLPGVISGITLVFLPAVSLGHLAHHGGHHHDLDVADAQGGRSGRLAGKGVRSA